MVCPLGIKSKGSLLVVGVGMVVTTGLVADGSSKISLSLIGVLLTPVTLGSELVTLVFVTLIEATKFESKSFVTVIEAVTGVTVTELLSTDSIILPIVILVTFGEGMVVTTGDVDLGAGISSTISTLG